ncbi:MAG: hypothetical protein VX018_00120 [Bacteroidota bacterium]|nr:hypothetical protein [Bacteroidota bacterium]
MKPITLIFILIFIPNISFSQKSEVKVIEDLILEQKYFLADSILKEKILNNNRVSSELTFLFGKNSFFLEKYEQSINWLNKYLELKGESGIFSDESIKFLELSNSKNLIENSKNIENVYVELYSYNYIDCQNNRKVCPICKGTSVMIIETDVSKIYKTCPFSDNKGFLTCDEYNLFLRGKLKPKTSN